MVGSTCILYIWHSNVLLSRTFLNEAFTSFLSFLDNSDVALPAVDPRTISPSGHDDFEVAEEHFQQTNEHEIKIENATNRNSFHFHIDNDETSKIQEQKTIIKAKRNIKPRVSIY